MTAPLCDADFTAHIGKRVRFAGWHGALRLESVEAQPRSTMPGAARTPFTLIFHGQAGDVLAEGLYRASIEQGPELDLYIMPIHTVTPGRQEYQVVFN